MTLELREDSSFVSSQVDKTIKLECAFKYWSDSFGEIKPAVFRP